MPSHYRFNYLTFFFSVYRLKIRYLFHSMDKVISNNEKFSYSFFLAYFIFFFLLPLSFYFISYFSFLEEWIKMKLTSIVWGAHMNIICIEMDKNKENERKNMFFFVLAGILDWLVFLCEVRWRFEFFCGF